MFDAAHAVRPGWVDDGLFPFESHFVGIDGNTVHYVDEGAGPTLLLLHGSSPRSRPACPGSLTCQL